ncbi:UNVERIFIED_CONTAM: hypothetical protein HDU68_004414, partial [Siphonaria sp. JEL0065]
QVGEHLECDLSGDCFGDEDGGDENLWIAVFVSVMTARDVVVLKCIAAGNLTFFAVRLAIV